MDLAKLFQLQRQLDEHIEREHPRQEGEDRLAKKILALLVELGELANEARFFKYWSNDQEPRIGIPSVHYDEKLGHDVVEYVGPNPLLEEYADGLHFVLSIGVELKLYEYTNVDSIRSTNLIEQFMSIIYWLHQLHWSIEFKGNCIYEYNVLCAYFFGLGEMLGFSWQEIEEAYMQKNAENHSRQERGY
ncbi:dUTP diphosphatase [Aneurinibacillus thermoaerophilus]|uniref:Dimeric dUTPase, all-alpha-NTP-PPase (MazG) superfamily n=1 Tax=Aneurinibacillus thermoaerophilus TaxID=143495 RepID=A0A1G8APN0_ANETH|nr:dUTP diphosphatase [Aneurinibacillus thermoaerophilus]MED0758757.1 dUTP diphosphatase [Aneurinibacillus thermoaerophilus]MED0760595.1 dUTP diphosphatase [Aneurinibacillus thermoaerophilus]SDH22887.1 Dimeric dUTPase, all-alpha-NTP-PPase (MazG) superfamily [Aneurinibacillus thermoaerophilus]